MTTPDSSDARTTSESQANAQIPVHAQSGLPPISELFSQSWGKLKLGILNALLLTIIYLVAFIPVILVGGGIFAGLTAAVMPLGEIASLIEAERYIELVTALGPTLLIAGGSFFIFMTIVGTVLVSVYTGAMTYAFAWAEKKPSLGEVLRAAFGKVGWLILATLLVGALTFGSFWLLFLPALLISIFSGFTLLEILLENKKPLEALQNSISLTAAHFWGIVGRWLLYFVGYIILSMVFSELARVSNDLVSTVFRLVNTIFSYLSGWFVMAFMVTLYMHVKATTPAPAPKKGVFTTFVVLAVLGWLIFGIGLVAAINLVQTNLPRWSETAALSKSISKTYSDSGAAANIETLPVKTSCDFELGIPTNSGTDERYWIYEERMVAASAFRGLAPNKQTAAGVQAGYLSYKTDEQRLPKDGDAPFDIGYPGLRIYCVANTEKLTLERFVERATASTDYTITTNGSNRAYGDLLVQPVTIAGLTNGDYYNEQGYIAVTPGPTSQLVLIQTVGTDADDADIEKIYMQLEAAGNTIKSN
jgi:hypothetical protein